MTWSSLFPPYLKKIIIIQVYKSPGLRLVLINFALTLLAAAFAARRGSEGGGGDRCAAPEQPDPAGELPEADGVAEGPDRD